MIPENLSYLVSTSAFIVALVSLLLARKNWRESNRPIVTAFVEDDTAGGTAIYNLVVSNTGNRPAVNVRLHATDDQIAALLDPAAEKKMLDIIAYNFRPESSVPLLRNGEDLSTSFGSFSTNEQNAKCLKYASEAKVVLTYGDLDGRRYRSKLILKVYARQGFGGGTWVKQKPFRNRSSQSE